MEETLPSIQRDTEADDKRFLNVGELAVLLGVSRWTIFRLCREKQLPYIPYGRIKRFDRKQIEDAISKRTVKARI